MNGLHDVGGMHGFRTVPTNDSYFDEDWERRAFAMSQAIGFYGLWNLDCSRAIGESVSPVDYANVSYFEAGFRRLLKCLVDYKLVSAEELTGAIPPIPVADCRPLQPEQVDTLSRKGTSYARSPHSDPAFKVGDRVRLRMINPRGHTRLPRYARGQVGMVERVQGFHVFPDTNAVGAGENPQWLYAISIDLKAIWGESYEANDCLTLDAWESYLEWPDAGAMTGH